MHTGDIDTPDKLYAYFEGCSTGLIENGYDMVDVV